MVKEKIKNKALWRERRWRLEEAERTACSRDHQGTGMTERKLERRQREGQAGPAQVTPSHSNAGVGTNGKSFWEATLAALIKKKQTHKISYI